MVVHISRCALRAEYDCREQQFDVSVWWLALVFYPVADLLWSMARRLHKGTPFAPDNQHFHTLLFTSIPASEVAPWYY